MKNISAFVLIMVASIGSVQGQNSTVPELNEMNKYEGYFDFYYSEKEDKIYLHVDKIDSQFLYVSSLSQGIGNNDLGLDRGQLGGKHVVYFQKRGSKLLLTAPNLKFRANTENELEQKSVEQAFAKSVLFGFPILDTTDTGFLIDFTSFVLRDAHKIGTKLKSSKEGSYKLDLNRSALALDHVKAFPKNVEFEALITLEGVATGNKVHSVSPIKEIVTVYQHHSFIELPDIRYKTRKFDKRAASFPIRYMDYGNAIDEAIVEKLICRHRLEKKNPLASMSEAVEPIIYYLDNGTPEPVRSALLEGASWWNQAFEAIGFKDAFQVKMLPAEADPMDVRYNVIQWVH